MNGIQKLSVVVAVLLLAVTAIAAREDIFRSKRPVEIGTAHKVYLEQCYDRNISEISVDYVLRLRTEDGWELTAATFKRSYNNDLYTLFFKRYVRR